MLSSKKYLNELIIKGMVSKYFKRPCYLHVTNISEEEVIGFFGNRKKLVSFTYADDDKYKILKESSVYISNDDYKEYSRLLKIESRRNKINKVIYGFV